MRVKLGDICHFQSGGTPSKQNTSYYGGVIPWITTVALNGTAISEKDAIEWITEKAIKESAAKIVPAHSLMVGTRVGVGKVAINNIPMSTSQDIISLIDIDENTWHKPYLCKFIQSQNPYLTSQARGATIKGIKIDVLSELQLPIIPLQTQISISDILDKISNLIAMRKKQFQKLDDLVKARFVEMFGDPKDNPNGYAKRQLKETCIVITGNTPSRAVSEYYGEHIEWIKTDNIVNGLINPTPAVESLSEKGMTVSRTVEKNSILMACIAGSITSIGRVCVTDRKVAFNQQINAIVPGSYNVLFLYVLLQISKEYLVEEINMALKGILSKSKLEEKSFIVPPMELQEQFAAFVEQTDKSKLTIQQSLDKLELIKKALMQKYFR